jgi:hypothetical protein
MEILLDSFKWKWYTNGGWLMHASIKFCFSFRNPSPNSFAKIILNTN